MASCAWASRALLLVALHPPSHGQPQQHNNKQLLFFFLLVEAEDSLAALHGERLCRRARLWVWKTSCHRLLWKARHLNVLVSENKRLCTQILPQMELNKT